MAKIDITLDKRTLLGKNIFNFLVGMKYLDENKPGFINIDEKTSEGKKIVSFLYSLGCVVNSPYNPEYVAKIRKAEKEIEQGKCTEVVDIDKFIDEL